MTLRDEDGPLYTVQYLKGQLQGALSSLEQVENDVRGRRELPPDPTVPHGYASWRDYALALESIGDAADKYRAKLEEDMRAFQAASDLNEVSPPQGYVTWPEYYRAQVERMERLDPDGRINELTEECQELRARISRQRRELKQVNRCIREQKLELEVLRGRGTAYVRPVYTEAGITIWENAAGERMPLPTGARPSEGFSAEFLNRTQPIEKQPTPSKLVTSEEAQRIGREVREDFKQAVRMNDGFKLAIDRLESRGKR